MTRPSAHVLIGFAEALPAPEVFFSLHDAGHRVSAFTRKGAQTPLAKHLPCVAVHEIAAPETDAQAAQDALAQLMQGPDAPDLLLPMDDAALWLANAALPQDARIVGAQGDQAALALDKTLQVVAAKAAGLPLPETAVVRKPEDLSASLPFPCIAKPALAITVRDGHIAKDRVDYLPDRAAADALAATLDADMAPLLVQPLVAGVGEGVFGFATAEGITHWSGHRRLRMMNPHGSGSSACLAQMPSEDLKAQCTRFLQSAGWRGPFMIELLRDADGTPWFMELNGRMWGSMALARGQGLEYPAWAVAATQSAGFTPPEITLPKTPLEARHLGRDLVHLLFVLRGPSTAFYRAGWPKLGKSLTAVLRRDKARRLYNHHPDFPGFAWRDALHTLRRAIAR